MMEETRTDEIMEEAILPEEDGADTAPELPEGRDFDTEVRSLFSARPELRGQELPQEVLLACIDGKPLTEAYNDYAKAQRKDADSLRRENRVLRQNAKAAAQAPIRGVTRGGGTDTKPEDAFLRGFNSAW